MISEYALNFLRYNIKKAVNMSTFIQCVNSKTGLMQWKVADENHDYCQEIARSGYADMLHDTERNQKYYEGLKVAIATMRSRGLPAKVLDIGTGTGLLSMMAAKLGADSVTACEAFKPMASCASKIFLKNGFPNIKLISKRSTEIKVGKDGDMEERANILVTEVFDTELIGEGAIPTFNHAHEHLLERDCLVVPASAIMYVQVVESNFLKCLHQIQPIEFDKNLKINSIFPPKEISTCPGSICLHDAQLSQLLNGRFLPLTNPVPVFRFDFETSVPIMVKDKSETEALAVNSGKTHAVFMWWDLLMDPKGEIIISCAPYWEHVQGENAQWRDHWMQAIYYLKDSHEISRGEGLMVRSFHDEYSLWFDVMQKSSLNISIPNLEMPHCKCGAHIALSRRRIGMLNDRTRLFKLISALQNVINSETVCLSVSDGSLLPLIAARLGAKKTYSVEGHPLCAKVIENFVNSNDLDNQIKVISESPDNITESDIDDNKINVFISDPFFMTAVSPWENLTFYLNYLKGLVQTFGSPDKTTIFPCGAILWAVPVEFKEFWKIRYPVGIVEGFDLEPFDELVLGASERADSQIEPHALSEYVTKSLSTPIKVLEFDLIQQKLFENKSNSGVQKLESCGVLNGIALWMEWILDANNSVSDGPTEPIQAGCPIVWNNYSMQGVYFFRKHIHIDNSKLSAFSLNHNAELDDTGELQISFSFTE